MSEPVSNGGRDGAGRFTAGNPGGPGNPNLATLNKHRAALMRAIKSPDVKRSLAVMVEIFRDANISPSVRLAASIAYQNRVLGAPASTEILERIERLEALYEKANSAPQIAPRTNGNGHG
jgi:hypothetical protein